MESQSRGEQKGKGEIKRRSREQVESKYRASREQVYSLNFGFR